MLLLVVYVSIMGLLGTHIMFFIENGAWYGKSFFGAVLFFPVLLFPLVWIFRIPLNSLLSYATIPGMAMLAVYKANCYLKGCCGGKVLWFTEDGIPVHFPSQLVEMSVAVLITVLLLVIERKKWGQKRIYPLCLIIYGFARLILNNFRWEQPEFVGKLAPGAIWSIVAIFIGVIWLLVFYYWEIHKGYRKE